MTKEDFKNIIPKRRADSHKGDYGHLLVLAGSVGLTGAAALCSEAALVSGSGLVTLGIPKSLNQIMETKLTEVMTKPLPETRVLSLALKAGPEIIELAEMVDAVAIGPGLSRYSQTQTLVKKLILTIKKPLVLDADGINALQDDIGLLKRSNAPSVLTPHPGEMARLLGLTIEEVQNNREHISRKFATEHNVVLVLKGFRTIVADSRGGVFINETGNPGMATAGSGDILTGMIGSFLGQNITLFEAAKLAVYLHGLAGDLAAKEKGEISLIASDILDKLPEAFKTVTSNQ